MTKQDRARRDEIIAALTQRAGFETPETRNSDSLDFQEVAIWTLRDIIETAYQAGRDDAAAK